MAAELQRQLLTISAFTFTVIKTLPQKLTLAPGSRR
jgi:hypothetical protein